MPIRDKKGDGDMNIPELKKAMEVILLKYPRLLIDNDDRGIIKEIRILYSACQLLCDVSDKMEPKKGQYYPDKCQPYGEELGKILGYNIARSEDILWLTKKMMGLEEVIIKKAPSLRGTYSGIVKEIADAIRQSFEQGGGK